MFSHFAFYMIHVQIDISVWLSDRVLVIAWIIDPYRMVRIFSSEGEDLGEMM